MNDSSERVQAKIVINLGTYESGRNENLSKILLSL